MSAGEPLDVLVELSVRKDLRVQGPNTHVYADIQISHPDYEEPMFTFKEGPLVHSVDLSRTTGPIIRAIRGLHRDDEVTYRFTTPSVETFTPHLHITRPTDDLYTEIRDGVIARH